MLLLHTTLRRNPTECATAHIILCIRTCIHISLSIFLLLTFWSAHTHPLSTIVPALLRPPSFLRYLYAENLALWIALLPVLVLELVLIFKKSLQHSVQRFTFRCWTHLWRNMNHPPNSVTKILIRFQRNSRLFFLTKNHTGINTQRRKLQNKHFVRSYANINLAYSNNAYTIHTYGAYTHNDSFTFCLKWKGRREREREREKATRKRRRRSRRRRRKKKHIIVANK